MDLNESLGVRTRFHELHQGGGPPIDQGVAASVGIAAAATGGKKPRVEPAFPDVDARWKGSSFFRASARHSGRAPEHPYKPREKTGAIRSVPPRQ
jgi:hypothetical protein